MQNKSLFESGKGLERANARRLVHVIYLVPPNREHLGLAGLDKVLYSLPVCLLDDGNMQARNRISRTV